MRELKIIHLHFREPAQGVNADHYFGSLAAIYDSFSEQDVGVKYDILANCFARLGHHYENPKCVIKAGFVKTKRQTGKN